MATSISDLVDAADRGEPGASDTLFATLYAELHRIARQQLQRHGWGVSLGATSLLHEAYMDLAKHDPARFPDDLRALPLLLEARADGGVVLATSHSGGSRVEGDIARLFEDARVRYLFVRNSEAGCWMARVDRAAPGA